MTLLKQFIELEWIRKGVMSIMWTRFHLQISDKCIKKFTAIFFINKTITQYFSTADTDTPSFVRSPIAPLCLPWQRR